MLAAVCFGSNNLARSGEFYDSVLATIGLQRLNANDNEIGYGKTGGEPVIWLLVPFDGKPATRGNGSQVIFNAPDAQTVDRFHQSAIDNGGTDDGAPGPRDYAPGYYGAYCRDHDGNKLHVFTMLT